MAVLAEGERQEVWRLLMEEASRQRALVPISNVDLRAAVDAVDNWVDSNAASFNSALPLPARNLLTSQQKAMLLLYVVSRRFLNT